MSRRLNPAEKADNNGANPRAERSPCLWFANIPSNSKVRSHFKTLFVAFRIQKKEMFAASKRNEWFQLEDSGCRGILHSAASR